VVPVTGIGTGIETSTVPMYQSELCDADKRGRLVSSEPLFVGVGIVIAYFFDYGMSFVGGPISWRLPIACQCIFAIMVIGMVFGVPESPRYGLDFHTRVVWGSWLINNCVKMALLSQSPR
jgi:hypothetical protein